MTQHLNQQISAMVDRETAAWNAQNVDGLLDLFHPDMVWAWPPTNRDHDPTSWLLHLGRFDRQRWGEEWSELFASHALVHNRRNTVSIRVSEQGDAGLAVVDVDTLWRNRQTGVDQHWFGRATKIYVDMGEHWKMIDHLGLLLYPKE